MPIRSQIRSITGQIEPEHPELFALDFEKKMLNMTLGRWTEMVSLPPRGSFVDYDFHIARRLASTLRHVCPLRVVALSS